MKIDVLYLTWNRLEFTKFSFTQLITNTDWSRVNKLYIHDDESTDGTYDYVKATSRAKAFPVEVVLHQGRFGSPPAVMNWYLDQTDAEWFAKIDNDIVVPPGWLEAMLSVIETTPGVDCLGMEAGRGNSMTPDWDGVYRFQDGTHIGGVGLIRCEALHRLPRITEGNRDGWTKLQHEYGRVNRNGPLNIGWISPDLPVAQLDRVPFEPYMSLNAQYVEQGWGRPWGVWHIHADYWDWWPPERRSKAHRL